MHHSWPSFEKTENKFGPSSVWFDDQLHDSGNLVESVLYLLPILQVLKTRDYIQIEQANPYENIIIKPRPKLTKSIF